MIACVIALASCASPPATTSVPMSTSQPRSATSLSGQVHEEVNGYRRSKGAKPLARHAGLDRLAQQHADFLMKNRGKFSLHGKNVSHMGFEGRALAARERFQMDNLAENVVAASGGSGPDTAPKLVKLWAGSKGHEHTMRSAWTHTGVGVAVDKDGMVFSTQLFGVVGTSQMGLTERFRQF